MKGIFRQGLAGFFATLGGLAASEWVSENLLVSSLGSLIAICLFEYIYQLMPKTEISKNGVKFFYLGIIGHALAIVGLVLFFRFIRSDLGFGENVPFFVYLFGGVAVYGHCCWFPMGLYFYRISYLTGAIGAIFSISQFGLNPEMLFWSIVFGVSTPSLFLDEVLKKSDEWIYDSTDCAE